MKCDSTTSVRYNFTEDEVKRMLVDSLGLDVPIGSFSLLIYQPTFSFFISSGDEVPHSPTVATLTLSESIND